MLKSGVCYCGSILETLQFCMGFFGKRVKDFGVNQRSVYLHLRVVCVCVCVC